MESRLQDDPQIALLINNAGAGLPGGFADSDADSQERLIRLNVTSVVRLTRAVIPGFLKQGHGSVVNIASVLAVAPEMFPGIYSATKSFVLTFTGQLVSS